MNGWRPAWRLAMFATAAGIVAAGIALPVAWMVGHWIVAFPVGAVLSVGFGVLADPTLRRTLRRRLFQPAKASSTGGGDRG